MNPDHPVVGALNGQEIADKKSTSRVVSMTFNRRVPGKKDSPLNLLVVCSMLYQSLQVASVPLQRQHI